MMDLIAKNHYNHFSHAQRKRVESIQKFKVLVITTNAAENFELQFEVGTPSEDVKAFIESIVLEQVQSWCLPLRKRQEQAFFIMGTSGYQETNHVCP